MELVLNLHVTDIFACNMINLYSEDLLDKIGTRLVYMDIHDFLRILDKVKGFYISGTFKLSKDEEGKYVCKLIRDGNQLELNNKYQSKIPKMNVVDITDSKFSGWFGYDKPLIDLEIGRRYKISTNVGIITAEFQGMEDESDRNDPRFGPPRKDFYYKFKNIKNKNPQLFYYNGGEGRFKLH